MAIEAQNETPQEQPAALIADENTMTIWGETIGAILGNNKVAFEEIENTVRELKTKLDDQQATIEGKDTEIKLVMEKLTATKEALALLRCAPPAFQKLADGSIKFQVTLDTDAAAPLLSQAEGAEEDPAVFIPRSVGEALLAYSS
jgi:hypothetical protein